ncbi:MAG: DUF4384 domain-containing protein [Byssovorax sp.]
MPTSPRLAAVALLVLSALPGCGAASPSASTGGACAPRPFPALPEASTPQEKKAIERIRAQLDKVARDEAELCGGAGSEADRAAKKAAIEERRESLIALIKALETASSAGKRKRALDALYRDAVPVAERPEEITFRFGVSAELPGGGGEIDIAPGTELPTDTRVRFRVEVSQRSNVYIFQKAPNGAITVLFPEPRIGTKNPLEGGVLTEIPPNGQRFRLNDKDIGTENVYLVVSRAPLPSLDAALTRVKDGSISTVGQNDLLKALATVSPGAPPAGCATRALELDAPQASSTSGECRRSRGLVLDDPGDRPEGKGRQMEVRTDAGDDLIVKVFPFRHVRKSGVKMGLEEAGRADDEAGAESDGGPGGVGAPAGAPMMGGQGGKGGHAPAPSTPRGIVMED